MGFQHATPGRAAARKTEAPLVSTGLEDRVAGFRAVARCRGRCRVASVTGSQIIITEDGKLPETKKKISTIRRTGIHVYPIRKFMRSNAATCINQKILVHKGDTSRKARLRDGPARKR